MAKFSGNVKTDNHAASMSAKVELRQNVLAEIKPARVFDGFCGTGAMYQRVWKNADSYVGCDMRPWHKDHPPRYVADNRRLLRNLDLQAFNVFDLDAYGAPWEQMEILLARRPWAKGERGAVVITDGSSLKLRWGQSFGAMARLIGVTMGVPTTAGNEEIQALLLKAWLKKARVNPLRIWQAVGSSAAKVRYTAVVFEGGTPG